MVGRSRGSLVTAEKDLWFTFTQAGTYYIDIAQCLSLVNRRFYRQGMQYAVSDLEMNADGVVTNLVTRMPETWVVASAWEKCMRHWLEQQDDYAREAGIQSTTAAYRDFKVYLDDVHTALPGGMLGNSLPQGVRDLTLLPAGAVYEWDESQVVIPNDGAVGVTTERTFHMIGGDVGSTSAGMIEAYAESRSRPFAVDPNFVDVPTGGILGKMEDVGDDGADIVTNLQSNNHKPPYVIGDNTVTEFYPGGSLWAVNPEAHTETIMTIRNTAPTGGIFHTTYSPGFLANCGLLRLTIAYPDVENHPSAVFLKVGLLGGEYKGVAARSMAVVN